MKKTICMLLTLIMIFTIVACNVKESETKSTFAQPSSTEVKRPRVAVILTKPGDASIVDATLIGYNRAIKELPIEGRYIEQSQDSSKYRAMVVDAFESSDIVIATAGWGLIDYMIEAAKEYPNVKVLVEDTPIDQEGIKDLPNYLGMMAASSEVSYVAGYLAMRMSKTSKIGIIVGVEYPVLSDFITGFISGALKANPDGRVAVSASGDWYDQASAKETALAQIQLGVDVIYAVGAASSFGTLEACKEKGIWGIGCDTDVAALFVGKDDKQADVILTSAYKDWGSAAYNFLERIITDPSQIPWGTVEIANYANGGVRIIKNDIYNKQVPKNIQEEISSLEAKITSGEIKVPSFFNMTRAEYDALKDSVKLK